MTREDKDNTIGDNNEKQVKFKLPNNLYKQGGLDRVRIPENITHIEGKPFGDVWDRVAENNKRFRNGKGEKER